jgi:hypothetical protein
VRGNSSFVRIYWAVGGKPSLLSNGHEDEREGSANNNAGDGHEGQVLAFHY